MDIYTSLTSTNKTTVFVTDNQFSGDSQEKRFQFTFLRSTYTRQNVIWPLAQSGKVQNT